ncbi:hypothetical protein BU14_2608s0001 [Porphyra umbilicalis]|uniref:Uncharacterized protein n=1 Tax=Porphyra umbilicalis TaxID=2786 RepID=A0A1X6NJ16_PORUM|nr:hypothetical protein BU14_2608s0001 [Porphyra umbilicalis]|eukprot:OSX68540.1 hypothetical protein BU14_2608s0001 [Porphyra umbilicalis]
MEVRAAGAVAAPLPCANGPTTAVCGPGWLMPARPADVGGAVDVSSVPVQRGVAVRGRARVVAAARGGVLSDAALPVPAPPAAAARGGTCTPRGTRPPLCGRLRWWRGGRAGGPPPPVHAAGGRRLSMRRVAWGRVGGNVGAGGAGAHWGGGGRRP